jgi:toxin ParE1/3/4
MPGEVTWHLRARHDLSDIYIAVGRENPRAAERLYDAIEAKTYLLADYPRLGPRRDDISRGARVLTERPYLIIYEIVPDTDDGPVVSVTIVRIVDGRRHLGRLHR